MGAAERWRRLRAAVAARKRFACFEVRRLPDGRERWTEFRAHWTWGAAERCAGWAEVNLVPLQWVVRAELAYRSQRREWAGVHGQPHRPPAVGPGGGIEQIAAIVRSHWRSGAFAGTHFAAGREVWERMLTLTPPPVRPAIPDGTVGGPIGSIPVRIDPGLSDVEWRLVDNATGAFLAAGTVH